MVYNYEDNVEEDIEFYNTSNKEKHRKRIKNKVKYKNKLKKQWNELNQRYFSCPILPKDKKRNYTLDPTKIVYYEKVSRKNHITYLNFCKRYSNKRVRKHIKYIDEYEWFCFHESWMDKEYENQYCDDFGYEWDLRKIIDIDDKYHLGLKSNNYRKCFRYFAWLFC